MNRVFSFALWLDAFFKARGHKYIKRVPSGTTKTGRVRYRYIYKVGHTHRGKHVDHHDDMVEGSKFMIGTKTGEEVHLHITGVSKDGMLTIVYDDGAKKGQEETMSKDQLAQLLDKEHGVKQTLESRRKKLEDELKEMKESGRASEKQIARVQRELDRYAKKEEPKPKPKPKRKRTPSKKKEVVDFSKFNTAEGKKELIDGIKSRLLTGKEDAFAFVRLEKDVENKMNRKFYTDIEKAVTLYNTLNDRLPKNGAKLKEALKQGIELPEGITLKADMEDYGQLKIIQDGEKRTIGLRQGYEPKWFSVNDEVKIFLVGSGQTKKVGRNDLLAYLTVAYRRMQETGEKVGALYNRKPVLFEHKFMRAMVDEVNNKPFKNPASLEVKGQAQELKGQRAEAKSKQDAVIKELNQRVEKDPYKIIEKRTQASEQEKRQREESPLVDLDVDSLFNEDSLRSRLSNVTYSPERMISILKRDLKGDLIRLNDAGYNLLTEGNETKVQNAVSRKEKKLKDLFMSYVNAKANTSNWAVTGRGGRNNRRENKKLDAEKKRLDALLEFSNDMERSLKREIGETDQAVSDKESKVIAHMEDLLLAQERVSVIQDTSLSNEQKKDKLVQLIPEHIASRSGYTGEEGRKRKATEMLRIRPEDPVRGVIQAVNEEQARLRNAKRELFESKGILAKGAFSKVADLIKKINEQEGAQQ